MNFALCKRALSPARHVLEDTPHQTRPKIDAGDATLLMGSITLLDLVIGKGRGFGRFVRHIMRDIRHDKNAM